MNVVICDDSAVARKSLARAIPDKVRIQFAKDGNEALSLISEEIPDILFLDLTMPSMDGFGVLQALQVDNIALYTVVISGDVQPESKARAVKYGADSFIEKPFSKEAIYNILVSIDPNMQLPDSINKKSPSVTGDVSEHLQELSNISLGRAAKSLVESFGDYIQMPIPNVTYGTCCDLQMIIDSFSQDDKDNMVTQRFVAGMAKGEIISYVQAADFTHIRECLKIHYSCSENEVVSSFVNFLNSAFLNQLGKLLGIDFILRSPVMINRDTRIEGNNQPLLLIEFSCAMENKDVVLHTLIVFSFESKLYLSDILGIDS